MLVRVDEAPKADWAAELPSGKLLKDRLAPLADLEHDHEGFAEWEAAADPESVRAESAQRSFRGQYLRHVRRRLQRARHSDTTLTDQDHPHGWR